MVPSAVFHELKIHIWQGWVILQFLNVGNLFRSGQSCRAVHCVSGDQTRPRCGHVVGSVPKGSEGTGHGTHPPSLQPRAPVGRAQPTGPHQPGRAPCPPTPRPRPLTAVRLARPVLARSCRPAGVNVAGMSYLLTARVRAQKCRQALSWLRTQAQRRVRLDSCGLRGNGPADLRARKLPL